MISVSRKKIKIICLFQDRLNEVSPLPWLSKISCCGTKRMVWSRVVLKFQVIGRTFSNILKIAPKLIFMWIFSQNNKYAICRINFVWILRFLNHYCNKSRQFVSLRTNLDSLCLNIFRKITHLSMHWAIFSIQSISLLNTVF